MSKYRIPQLEKLYEKQLKLAGIVNLSADTIDSLLSIWYRGLIEYCKDFAHGSVLTLESLSSEEARKKVSGTSFSFEKFLTYVYDTLPSKYLM